VLRRHSYTAVVFVPSAHLGALNTWDGQHPVLSRLRVMSAARLRAMAAGTWEIASHSAHHVDLRTIETGARRRELSASRAALSELVGRPVRALAYPFGYENQSVRRDAAAAGFELGFVANPYPASDRMRLPRRAITNLDRGGVLNLRLAGRPWLYRLEDGARVPVRGARQLGMAARERVAGRHGQQWS
ncbi:MAG: polysaccharide deacetylase family protein, partial [Chloroflexota bacterium]